MLGSAFENSLRTERHPGTLDFPDTAFFRRQKASSSDSRQELPTPNEVREYAGNADYGTVTLPDLGVFVKWGREDLVRIEEAQSLQAVRRAFPNNEVPFPELVAWRSQAYINYIYMSLVPGVTLSSRWSTLITGEWATIADQLGEFLKTLRSVRQRSDEYVGENVKPFRERSAGWLARTHKVLLIVARPKQRSSLSANSTP